MEAERSVIVIFDVQPLKALHLPKDVGLLPRSIAERTGRDSLLIAVQGKDRIEPSMEAGKSRVELRLVPQRFGHGESLSSVWYALNALSVAKALAAEARSSRLLLLFHAHPAVLLYGIVYKALNPRGKIWLKLDMDDRGLDHFMHKKARLGLYLRSADLVSVESVGVQKRLNKVWGRVRHTVCVPDGYDAEFYPVDDGRLSASRRPLFLTVGRLGSYQKNSECFLDAIGFLEPGKEEFRFIGEASPDFRRRLAEVSGRNITFHERIDDRDALFGQYEEARVFVLTSRYERFGIVLVEAMAHGCYLISTDLSSARDIIGGDEGVGLIVPQDDPVALAVALRRAASINIDHQAIAQKARRFYYRNIVSALPWMPGGGGLAKARTGGCWRPSISVALASYNGAGFIAEQLDSILAQDCTEDIEIVVSDDCSADSTLAILREYEKRYPEKVRVIENSRNEGLIKNFEKAIAACNGDFIALSDQDDRWRSDKLRVLSCSMFDGATLVFSDMEIVDETLRDLGSSMWKEIGLGPLVLRSIRAGKGYKHFLRENKIAGCSMMARRDFLLSCLPIPEYYLHDEWIALLASLVGRIVPCRDRLSLYRQHQAQQIGAGGLGFSESASFVPSTDHLAAAKIKRGALIEKLGKLKVDQKKIDFVAGWTRGRNLAEERRYGRFSSGSILASLLDGSYFRYLSGFKALGKDVLRLLRERP